MNGEIAENAIFTHHPGMGRPRSAEIQDVWSKRARFVELLDAKLAAGTTYEEIARALHLTKTRSLEHEWRYDRSRRPGRKTLEFAAPFFGVEIWELDGPAPDDEFGNIMGILGPGLTDEMKQVMIQMARAGQVKGRARQEADLVATTKEGVTIVVETKASDKKGTSLAVPSIARIAKHHAAMLRRDEEEELVPVKKGKGGKG